MTKHLRHDDIRPPQPSRVQHRTESVLLQVLIGAIVVLSFISCGCASLYKPKVALPTTYYDQVLKDVSQPDLLAKYNALPDSDKAAKVARRNQILQELIVLVDRNY